VAPSQQRVADRAGEAGRQRRRRGRLEGDRRGGGSQRRVGEGRQSPSYKFQLTCDQPCPRASTRLVGTLDCTSMPCPKLGLLGGLGERQFLLVLLLFLLFTVELLLIFILFTKMFFRLQCFPLSIHFPISVQYFFLCLPFSNPFAF
jgi:hypothetical protein